MPKIRQTITDQHPYRLRVLHRHGIPALFAFCLGVFVAVSFGLVLWRDNFRSMVHLCGLQNARIALPHFFKTRVTENEYLETIPTASGYALGSLALNNATAQPRILCLILTMPDNIEKAKAMKQTWLRRCNGYLFISTKNNSDLPSQDVGLPEKREMLWGKTKFGFRFAYEVREDFDWFLKVDDDTYVVMENLRMLLSNHSAENALYFGCHFKVLVTDGYMSGGAGYVLSRKSLDLLVEKGINSDKCRKENDGMEDLEMGRCLNQVGVKPGDSRDDTGHNRFFPMSPASHMEPGHMERDWWYPQYVKYPEKELKVEKNRVDCCSDTAISFHYVDDMYIFEYLLYHLRPYQNPDQTSFRKIK